MMEAHDDLRLRALAFCVGALMVVASELKCFDNSRVLGPRPITQAITAFRPDRLSVHAIRGL
jgi:hypothetical protein